MLALPKPLPFPYRKPLRLSERKTVTLLAAFKCSDGYVVCADSQESVGEYRVARQKIDPRDCGNFQLAIAGSGYNGELIDGFAERIEENVRINSVIKTLPQLKQFIHEELLDYRRNEAKDYSQKEKDMRFIVVARSLEPPAVEVWRTAASRLIPVTDKEPVLVGWQESLYEHVAQQLYMVKRSPPLIQGIIMGLHVMTLAKSTSKNVERPFTIVIARPNGLWVEDSSIVGELEEMVGVFVTQLNNLLLFCPDASLTTTQFSKRLQEFAATAERLRSEYLGFVLKTMMTRGLNALNDPYCRVPPGMMLSIEDNGDIKVIAEGDRLEDLPNILKAGETYQREQLKKFLESIEQFQHRSGAKVQRSD